MQRLIRQSLLAGFVIWAGASSASAQPHSVPPLVIPSTPDRHVGKPIFLELVTPDLDASELFYGQMFGWRFRATEDKAPDYAVATINDHPVAGLIRREVAGPLTRKPAWLTMFSVRDADATKVLAEQYGAHVVRPPKDIPGLGRQAIYADPQGAIFGTLVSVSGDPEDELVPLGQWIWSSLHTTDPDTDAGFYQSIFSYQVFDLPDDNGGGHFMLASDEYARASVNRLPAGQAYRYPYWLNYIRVLNTDDTITKLRALGGKVIVPPHSDRHGGQIAVVSDPNGAAFGLLEWTAFDSKEVLP